MASKKEQTIKTDLAPSEVKELLRDVIQRNLELGKQGKPTITIGIFGPAGCAKTSVAEQVAQEFKMEFIKENVAEKEAGDLIGFPCIELEVKYVEKGKEDMHMWVNKDTIESFIKIGYVPTGRDRMSFAKPDFIEGKDHSPCIMLLDDFSRCLPSMQNAIMNLTDRQKYSSWSLFPGSTVILTANPDDGEDSFMVNTLDKAQQTRFLRINMKPSVDDWALQMEKEGMDDRFINFLLKHKEIIEGTGDGNTTELANLRIWTKFFTVISMYKDLTPNWNKILNLGQNSVPKEHLMLLHTFIENKLDKLPTVEELLNIGTKEELNKVLEGSIGSGNKKRMDISSIISRRLMNFGMTNAGKFNKKMIDNYRQILDSDYISPDLVLLTLKKKEMQPLFAKGLTDTKLFRKMMVLESA